MMSDEPVTYFMQNETAGYVGNSPLWWPRSNSGYTDRVDDAKEFTKEEADKLIYGTRGTHRWRPWLKSLVLSVTYRVVDVQALQNLPGLEDVEEPTEPSRFIECPACRKRAPLSAALCYCGWPLDRGYS